MTDSDGHFPEHLSHDEYLRRRIRDVDAGMQNLADVVFARLHALEQALIELNLAHFVPSEPNVPVRIDGDVMTVTRPGTMTFSTLKTEKA